MSRQINVNVSSTAGVGKTTLARLIAFACEANGIEYTLDDFDYDTTTDGVGDLTDLKQRIKTMQAKGTTVNITTTQLRRENENA